MRVCGSLLIICLLSVNVAQRDGRRLTLPQQHVDGAASTWSAPASSAHTGGIEPLRADRPAKAENGVTEPKRKANAPPPNRLDRLSAGAAAKRAADGVIALPRRRLSLPPVDRIGMRRLPSARG
ncbi:osteocrin [Phyllopteryx taeniolatus]|uniref:osteocrin n=1 Tax=Phyllopteryx taeniolatus TaxID=161469 RepID=UPI002AD3DCCD|nr:osteocrin [Phyllopteryx taeniolatus]